MLDDIFMRILDMTKIGSLVILVVILARLMLKRAPKVFSYVLWAVVLLRLLCPIALETPVSLVPEVTPVAQDYSLQGESISILGAGTAASRAVGDALNGGLGIQQVYTTQQEADGTPRIVTGSWWDIWILFGQYVWIAGVAGMHLHSLHSYGKLRKKLAVAVVLRDNIFIADDIQSPMVAGLLRPKIYLPGNLSEQEQPYIILHEQYHIRRFDHLIKALAYLALCLHWFNPLVWLAFTLATRDMEMSCDEAVIRQLGAEVRADYSASLLTLATGRRINGLTPLAFGEGDPKGRIRNLAKWKKPARRVTVIAVILCMVLTVCLLTDPVSGRGKEAGETFYYGIAADFAQSADGENGSFITIVCDDGTEERFRIAEDDEPPEDLAGKYVMVRGEYETHTGLRVTSRIVVTDKIASDTLEEAINSAVLHFNWSNRYEDAYQCASFINLAQRKSGSHVTVYGLAFHEAYLVEDGALIPDSGSHVPVALTFHLTDSGTYVLTEYWEPRDGTYYNGDIKAKFPAFVWPDTQEYVMTQIQNCYVQAAEYFHLDTEGVISGLLDQICEEGVNYDTAEEVRLYHAIEYRELLYYGQYTLQSCFSEFLQGGQSGPRAQVMKLACQEIMTEWGEDFAASSSDPQLWFDDFAAHAYRAWEQHSDEVLRQDYPASWILLQLTGDVGNAQGSAFANGFEIRLYSDKETYTTDEAIRIWATLEYQGEGETVTVWHGTPMISFSITDGGDFQTGGMVGTILTGTELNKGEVYRFDYAKSGAYSEDGPDADFWREFYQEEDLKLPAGTYTVSVSGDFHLSEQQRPDESGPSCELQITVTE